MNNDIFFIVLYTLVGGGLGTLIILIVARYVPGLIDRLTPNIDEQREIARGNQAAAQFYGLVSAAVIIGVSIVVAAAVLGGLQTGAGILSPPQTLKQSFSQQPAEAPLDANHTESSDINGTQ